MLSAKKCFVYILKTWNIFHFGSFYVQTSTVYCSLKFAQPFSSWMFHKNYLFLKKLFFEPRVPYSVPGFFYLMYTIWHDAEIRTQTAARCATNELHSSHNYSMKMLLIWIQNVSTLIYFYNIYIILLSYRRLGCSEYNMSCRISIEQLCIVQ